MQDLVFPALFPFSEVARNFLKDKRVAPEEVPEIVIKRAALIISRANAGVDYTVDAATLSPDLLENEIVAFPVAKLILSVMKTPAIIQKFSTLVKKKTFNSLLASPKARDLCFLLADDFNVPYVLSEKKGFMVSVAMLDYLDILFVDDESKLVNKQVEKGRVLLTLNDFARFLSEKAYKRVFESLPIEKKFVPKAFEAYAKSIDPQLSVIEKKSFDLRISGKVDPECFPPCMLALYSDMAGGKKLPHLARLSLASFLSQVNMPKSDVIALFAKSPDYKKHVTDYHVDRIFEKQLSAPGCKKMAEYGLKVPACEKACIYKHPVQFYTANLRTKNRIKNKSTPAPSSRSTA